MIPDSRKRSPSSLFLIPNSSKSSAFTLIEVLISIAIIALLISTAVFIINPAQRFAETRNDQRELNINVILNAIGQNITNNTGAFACTAGVIPTTTPTVIGSSTYDIYDCLVTEYISEMPVDPKTGIAGTSTSYNTRYSIVQNPTTTQITVAALDAELGELITITR